MDEGSGNTVNISGTTTYFVLQYIKAKKGEASYRAFIKGFEERSGKIIDERNMKGTKVPLEIQNGLITEGLGIPPNGLSEKDRETLDDLGRYLARSEISPLVRMFLGSLDLMNLVERLPKRWENQFTSGKMEIARYDEKDRIITLRLCDFEDQPEAFWRTLEAYLCETVRCFGNKNVRISEMDAKGCGPNCRLFGIAWDPK